MTMNRRLLLGLPILLLAGGRELAAQAPGKLEPAAPPFPVPIFDNGTAANDTSYRKDVTLVTPADRQIVKIGMQKGGKVYIAPKMRYTVIGGDFARNLAIEFDTQGIMLRHDGAKATKTNIILHFVDGRNVNFVINIGAAPNKVMYFQIT